MFDNKKFGSTVRFIRKNKGLTILQFAHELNISDTYLGQIETGSKTPSIELVVYILNSLGLSFEESNKFFNAQNEVSKFEYKDMLYLLDDDDCEFLYELVTKSTWKKEDFD